MKIQSVSVRNFLTFGEKESRLTKLGDRTILVGPNGAGKTNLLRAIEFAIAALQRPRPDPTPYVREAETGRRLRVELGVAFTEEEARLIASVMAYCATTNPQNIQNLRDFNELPSLVRRRIAEGPGLFRDLLRQRVRLVVEGQAGDPNSTQCRLHFGLDKLGLVLADFGLFRSPTITLTSWTSQNLLERMAAVLEGERPGTIFNTPLPADRAPHPGPFGFEWLRDLLDPAPDGRPVSLQMQGISLYQQNQGVRQDDEDFLRMRNELWFRGWALGDIGPQTAFACVLGSSIVHLSGAREQPGGEPILRAPVPNPRVKTVTGKDLAHGLFELKNNPSPAGRYRYEQIRSKFTELTTHEVDVVVVGQTPSPGEEPSFPPTLYPRLVMRSGNFEFPIEAEAAGNLEVLLVLYSTAGITDSVALLDEPALNLHPSKQRTLYSFLREAASTNRNQFFIVTHSTTFVAPDDLVSAVRVIPSVSGSTLRRLQYRSASERARAKREGQFNHELLSGLFADRALIFEGHDEAAALPIWFEKCPQGELMSSVNVVGINAEGMGSISPIAKVLKTWGVPFRAVADGKARAILRPLGRRALTFRRSDLTGLVNAAMPGGLRQQQRRYGTRAKSPTNFSAVARREPPPPAVLRLWKRLRPFIEGKEN